MPDDDWPLPGAEDRPATPTGGSAETDGSLADGEADTDGILPPASWWGPRLRWFMAEITVVGGVLIALALNAWWSGRQDEAKADAYLRQLASDLAETERVMTASDALLRPTERAVKRLLQSFGEPTPPVDSVLSWVDAALITDLPHPVLGTAQALVATGDLALIEDDSLRLAIANYLEAAQSQLEFYSTSARSLTIDSSDLIRRADLSEALSRLPQDEKEALYATDPTGLVPPPGWRAPFPLDVRRFYADREVYASIQLMAIWTANVAEDRDAFRTNATSLRRQVGGALAR